MSWQRDAEPLQTLTPQQLIGPALQAELRRWAVQVDRDNRVPAESFAALVDAGLMRFFIPETLGGVGGSTRSYVEVASAIGEECLSTALIWAMHCQQVAVLNALDEPPRDVLTSIAEDGALVASVTTESGKGGALLRSNSPLEEAEGGRWHLRRHAPVVSYGAEATFFLVTMQSPRRPEVALVLVRRGDGQIEVVDSWHSMGMRGTQSVAMDFDVVVGADRLVADSFRPLALRCMIPIGHLGWAGAWYGGARGLYRRVLQHFRRAGSEGKRNLNSETLQHRLAEIRLSLDLIYGLLTSAIRRMEELHSAGAPLAAYQSPEVQILFNNLKIGTSRMAFSVADELMQVCGLFDGYLEGRELGLERVFRDLRSASLMLNNQGLLNANGSFVFAEVGAG